MYIKQVEYVIILTNVSNFHRVRCAKIKAPTSDSIFKRDTHVLGNFHVVVLLCLLLQKSSVAAKLSWCTPCPCGAKMIVQVSSWVGCLSEGPALRDQLQPPED